METIIIILVILVAFAILWIGLITTAEVHPEVYDDIETLEDRIREARSYMCASDTIDQVDYEMLCRILDPKNEYSFNLLNDF